MKKSLLMACMAMMFFSCANEELPTKNEEIDVNNTYSLSLRVNKSSATKGIQTPGITGAALKSMIIEVFDGNRRKISTKELDADQIARAIDGGNALDDISRVIIKEIDARAEYVKIWAFQSEILSANLPDLGLSINNYQTGFASIPFYPVKGNIGNSETDANGFVSINKTNAPASGSNTSGNKIWTVETKLAPYFARFEMKPTTGIVPKTTAESAGDLNVFPEGTTIDITGIYMNNINDLKDAKSLILIQGNLNNWGNGDWKTGHPYDANGLWSNMYNAPGDHKTADSISFGLGADCYNLFAQETSSPHVVVRVRVHIPENTPLSDIYGTDYYGFITLRDFKISESVKLSSTGVETGKLYKVALDLTVKPTDISPDPESSLADLHAKVEIIDWVEVNLTPEL